MKRVILLLISAVLLASLPIMIFASDIRAADSSAAITIVIPDKPVADSPSAESAPLTRVNYLYPVSINETQDNGRHEIIKTYELGEDESPGDISRESFEREGWIYELTDITKKENISDDTREHTEIKEISTDTKDMDAILKLLKPSVEYVSDDGYCGVLSLDISTVKVQTAGTKNVSYTISSTREYPHLSSNDTSLVPKTISDNGSTLSLSSLEWRVQNRVTVDSDELPDSYTAVATYTGSATKTVTTGYITTAEYHGTISKSITGKTVYAAYFLGTQLVTPVTYMPNEITPYELTESDSESVPQGDAEDDSEKEQALNTGKAGTASGYKSAVNIPVVAATDKTSSKSFNPIPAIITIITSAAVIGGLICYDVHKKRRA